MRGRATGPFILRVEMHMEMTPNNDIDVLFEQFYEQDLLPFVKKQKHASCFEIMKQFHKTYADTVHLMDTLERRDIVDAAEPGVRGPRPLLNGKKKRCPPAIVATENLSTSKDSTPTAPTASPAVASAAPSKPARTSKTETATGPAPRRVKRR